MNHQCTKQSRDEEVTTLELVDYVPFHKRPYDDMNKQYSPAK